MLWLINVAADMNSFGDSKIVGTLNFQTFEFSNFLHTSIFDRYIVEI